MNAEIRATNNHPFNDILLEKFPNRASVIYESQYVLLRFIRLKADSETRRRLKGDSGRWRNH